MSNITVAQLASHAITTIAGLTDPQARGFIRANNIRSMGKLNTMLETLKGKSGEELESLCAAPAASTAAPASPAKKAAKKAGGAASKKADGEGKPKFEKKGRTARTTKVVEAGPRGFRFGEVWNNSVKAGEGIAILESNRPKLIAQATELGVAQSVIDSNDPAKLCKSIAHKLEKQEAEAAE